MSRRDPYALWRLTQPTPPTPPPDAPTAPPMMIGHTPSAPPAPAPMVAHTPTLMDPAMREAQARINAASRPNPQPLGDIVRQAVHIPVSAMDLMNVGGGEEMQTPAGPDTGPTIQAPSLLQRLQGLGMNYEPVRRAQSALQQLLPIAQNAFDPMNAEGFGGGGAMHAAGPLMRTAEEALPAIGARELAQVGATERILPAAHALGQDLHNAGITQNIIAAAERGSVGRYWYVNSKKAFDKYFGNVALPDGTMVNDAPLMAKLTAALSTSQGVKDNLVGAVETYTKWVAAGRPDDPKLIEPILDSVSRIGGKEYPARYNNAMTVLSGSKDIDAVDLSGFKVRSFWRNLVGLYDAATLDRHMATLAAVKQALFGSASGYLGSQQLWHEAARQLGWDPAEVQAASWTFIKPLTDMIREGIPAEEALAKASNLTRKDVQDFAKLIQSDKDVRELLNAHYQQQGSSLAEYEAAHGGPTIKHGREKGTPTAFTEDFLDRASQKIRADQAASRAARAAKKARQAGGK